MNESMNECLLSKIHAVQTYTGMNQIRAQGKGVKGIGEENR